MASYPFRPVQDTDVPPEPVQPHYVPPPPRALNGGLYTGEPFKKGAPWGNVPVIPDVDYMINVNLRSANPPPKALFQYPGNTRPGNNYQNNTGLQQSGSYNFLCVSCKTVKDPPRPECKCSKISPVSGNDFNKCFCDYLKYTHV